MADDAIKIDQSAPQTAPLAREVINARTLARQALEAITRVKSQMDHLTDGTTFTNLATICGVSPSQAESLYNLFAGATGAINGTSQTADYKTLTERVV